MNKLLLAVWVPLFLFSSCEGNKDEANEETRRQGERGGGPKNMGEFHEAMVEASREFERLENEGREAVDYVVSNLSDNSELFREHSREMKRVGRLKLAEKDAFDDASSKFLKSGGTLKTVERLRKSFGTFSGKIYR